MVECRRVLVVDDANLVRRYYRQALEGAGFTVGEALNGVEALEKVLAEPFDLLIVDVNMPYMDGLSFLKALRRQDSAASSVPVLIITTEAEAKDREAARTAGGNYDLVKPVSQPMLVEYAGLMCGPSHE
jgi:two-component system chemotaxis response regulator CheY